LFTIETSTTWLLSGTPILVTASSNYLFLGSNAKTGNVVSTLLPIQVLGQRIVLAASSNSATLTIGTPFASSPVFTITAYPLTATSSTVVFRGTNLPPGLTLSTVSGTLPGASAVLTGTPLSNVDSTLTSTITASVIGLSSSTTHQIYRQLKIQLGPDIGRSTLYVLSIKNNITSLSPAYAWGGWPWLASDNNENVRLHRVFDELGVKNYAISHGDSKWIAVGENADGTTKILTSAAIC
jgi:hypothetical protein